MKEALFVIVHEHCITIDMADHAAGKDPGLTRPEDYPSVSQELARIKGEEVFREVTGDPYKVPYTIPEGTRQIWVCGAYELVCVQVHVDTLQLACKGIAVGIHKPGTISFSV